MIADALCNIDAQKSTGDDKLEPFALKSSAQLISEYITHIFNLCITSGIFSAVWKTAYILPLHEGGNKSKLNNYHPIQELSCHVKTLESLVNEQLKSFVSADSILTCYFVSGLSIPLFLLLL